MSIWDDLQPASFRGVQFLMRSYEHEVGIAGQHHKYPGRNTGDVEHMNLEDESLPITAVVIGNSREIFQERKTLLDALLVPGPGELVHPMYGRLMVSLVPNQKIRISGDAETLGQIDISFRFIKAGTRTGPTSTVNTQAKSEEAVEDAKSTAKALLEEALKIMTVPDFVRDGLKEDIQTLETQSKDLATGQNVTGNEVGTSLKTVGDIASDVEALTKFKGPASDVLKVTSKLSQKFSEVVAAIPNATGPLATVSRKIQQANRFALKSFVTANSALEFIKVASSADFDSYDDAISTMKAGLDLLDNAIDQSGNDQLTGKLEDVRGTFATHIKQTSGNLGRIVTVAHNATQSTLLRAYDIYEDLSRAEEIAKRNKIKNPMHIPPTQELEVLNV